MKDKSRLVSSVIVSLLAGFIYYQFGNDITQNIDKSVKAIINFSDNEFPECSDLQKSDESINSFPNKTETHSGNTSKSLLRNNEADDFISGTDSENQVNLKQSLSLVGNPEISVMNNVQSQTKQTLPDNNNETNADIENIIKNSLGKNSVNYITFELNTQNLTEEFACNNKQYFKLNNNYRTGIYPDKKGNNPNPENFGVIEYSYIYENSCVNIDNEEHGNDYTVLKRNNNLKIECNSEETSGIKGKSKLKIMINISGDENKIELFEINSDSDVLEEEVM